ncbi:sigma-E factor negative regulatory protein [Aquabacterium sp.]|uniref:sigma-E factor negative regulatory protein n=1 Tax=Aquabacterium sp. TaxID=1872578 RepID=UPI002E373D79|nr:sigma-E factor negative regulatory protein [Aquabacterium sp.]HEX5312647.1 sigma-E factor negative regulatory protein [Aquabacterium sp.]
MNDRFNDSQAAREALSALADGEAHSSDVARACAAWRDDAQAKEAWRTYHLIGDVMRSDDLVRASGDGDFLNKLRGRLAQEPVVLAPVAAQSVADRQVAPIGEVAVTLKRRAWAGPMAVAASFVMLLGAVVSLQMGGSAESSSNQMAQGSAVVNRGIAAASSPESSLALASSTSVAGLPTQSSGNVSVEGASFSRPDPAAPILIRDPQVDQLLATLPRHANGGADTSFASQGGLARAAVVEQP